ncbi:disulfide bond formation protein DsbA [Flavobacterium akiainvivens]|uniref:Disulfide bond formation protein DsbA n=1 Tax=Flavobacterium akiainvivens TaxID=1202724 RepID=A0A0M8MAB7_9FLAO|nr:DsbA family oxidoreductase [Flavobacterium akiainvivens]KOS06913.1 disulfide bond formation protein DsbA [Flavobacterium akiainvivens]SFQ69777.1 Predicted dithiol-disulfide isomerase, DsbA family [Flavobacterium akiainvivens]
MKIEIWSDIMCPFCYIGKRRFEQALETFNGKDKVEIEWKSYLLSPEMVTDPTKNMHQFLAEHKGVSLEEATGMNDYVTNMAAETGLTYNFDKAIPANSFNAHRMLHFAKEFGLQNEAEEALFKAYFTDGKNIDDAATLSEIAASVGLNTTELAEAMGSEAYFQDVVMDVQEAQNIGVRGVPFFVFNRKYGVSGAQDAATFLEVLEKSYGEWQQASAPLDIIEGDSCGVDGKC